MKDVGKLTSARTTRSALRRSYVETTSYVTHRLCTTFGERGFPFSGPVIWNSLPADFTLHPG